MNKWAYVFTQAMFGLIGAAIAISVGVFAWSARDASDFGDPIFTLVPTFIGFVGIAMGLIFVVGSLTSIAHTVKYGAPPVSRFAPLSPRQRQQQLLQRRGTVSDSGAGPYSASESDSGSMFEPGSGSAFDSSSDFGGTSDSGGSPSAGDSSGT